MQQSVFINHTNHPSEGWEAEQVKAAECYGSIADVPFPDVDPRLDRDGVLDLAKKSLTTILEMNPSAVLCQGDFSYTYAMVNLLKQHNVTVLAASSERFSEMLDDGSIRKRISIFRFVRFREY